MSGADIIAARTLARDMPDGSRVVADLKVYRLGGNAHPHFSATGEVYDRRSNATGATRQRQGREPDVCGCVHDEVLRAFPQAAPFVAMHLSDYPSGLPMHAAANAAYFLREGNPDAAARLLRCDVSDLPADPDDVPAFVDAQAERFAAEAAAAFELLKVLA